MKGRVKRYALEGILIVVISLIFLLPFYFVIINSFKTAAEASLMNISWPKEFNLIENYKAVLTLQNGIVFRAFINSAIITVLSVFGLVIVCSMAGFVLQRRLSRASSLLNFLVLAGLMIPPAIVPTIWVLQLTGLFKTLAGISLVEIALFFSFCTILYKSFMSTVPREIDEAALVDGCGSLRLFFQIIFPLQLPVTSTVIILATVHVYNDFVNPLYFLPGVNNTTVQLTLYHFIGQLISSWNLLFANVVLISIPPLVLFMFFSKKIVSGMTAGAIK